MREIDTQPAIEAVNALPSAVLAVLERRYLDDFDDAAWLMLRADSSQQRPVLREIRQLGARRLQAGTDGGLSSLLTACAEPGHSLVLVVKGEADRQRLFLGVRRMPGARGSTGDRLDHVTAAFQAALPGLAFQDDVDVTDAPDDRLEDFSNFAVITGIPSSRDGSAPPSLDSVLQVARGSAFQLSIVAEPLDRAELERSMDALRHIRSELHGLVRQTETSSRSRTVGGGNSRAQDSGEPTSFLQRPSNLLGLSRLANVAATTGLRLLGPFAGLLQAGAYFAGGGAGTSATVQAHWSTTTQSGLSSERLDAIAEACEHAADQHLRRLQAAVAGGFWRVSIHLAAHGQSDLSKIAGAIRGHLTGETTHLDPMRSIEAPPDLVRDCMRRGRCIDIAPRTASQSGAGASAEVFDALATHQSSNELAHLFALPQAELPGLPLRQRIDFGLTAPLPGDRSVVLGRVEDRDGRLLADLPISADSLNRNTFVVGLVGSGKTTTCKRLLTAAWAQLGVPFLVVEPVKTEYRELALHAGIAGRLNVFSTASGEATPLRLNPLQPVPGFPVARHLDLLKAVFNAAFPMFAGMSYVLEEALVDVYAERGWHVRHDGTDAAAQCRSALERGALMPDLRALHDRVGQVLHSKGYGQEIQSNMGAALRSRLNSLLVGQKGALLDTRHSTPAELLFSRPAVIELHQLGDDEEKSFVMALLFVLLCEYAEVRQQELPPSQRGRLQHLTLIEEAHRLLSAPRGVFGAEVADARGKAVQMFTDLLAEMRAYGEGFIVADQIPTKLASEILKNTAVKITHRLASPDDRQAMGGACNLSLEQTSALNLLLPGQAVVHDADIGQAVRVRVRASNPAIPEMPAATAKVRELAWLRFGGGCEPCTEVCRWRQSLLGSELERGVDLAFDGMVAVLLDPSQPLPAIGSFDMAEDSTGRRYCAALFAVRRQLENWLIARHAAFGGGGLRVIDRIHVERCLSQAAPLLRRWSAGEAFGSEEWQPVRTAWFEVVATKPPRPRVGCRQCPMPCIALHEASARLPQLPPGLRALVNGLQPAALRVDAFEKGTAKLVDLPARPARHARALRYCLAVLCGGDRPTEEATALLRELAAEPEQGVAEKHGPC